MKKSVKKFNMGGMASMGGSPNAKQRMMEAAQMKQLGDAAQNAAAATARRQQAVPAPARTPPAPNRKMVRQVAMAKGGAVKGKKPAAAGVAIMIAMPAKSKGKTKMAMGGCATKKK